MWGRLSAVPLALALSAALASACAPGTIMGEGDEGGGPRPDGGAALAGSLELHFLDVGQGDATLIIGPDGSSVLFDGGPRGGEAVVRDAIATLAGGRLTGALLSHTDADHIGGLVGILRGVDGLAGTDDDLEPSMRFMGHSDADCDSKVCDEFRTLRAYPFAEPAIGDVISLGDATLTVVAAGGDVGEGVMAGIAEPNERSLAIVAEFAGRRVFVGGDLTGGGLGSVDVEGRIANSLGRLDVLHLNHHGSKTSSSQGFLDGTNPRALVISVGTDNAYCHPAAEVVDRISTLGAPIFATGSGVVTDGDRCGGPTPWPTQARPGLGSFSVVIEGSGDLTIAGEQL